MPNDNEPVDSNLEKVQNELVRKTRFKGMQPPVISNQRDLEVVNQQQVAAQRQAELLKKMFRGEIPIPDENEV